MKKINIIVSGGGTAGHIYPALAVAEKLRENGHNVLFVGAKGKMEMERVPQAGFKIVGLPIAGLKRKVSLENVGVALKLVRSMIKASVILKRFKPDVVVGFGGYASGPIVKSAQRLGIKTIIQEQNSYAGITNKLLGKKATFICCAYEGMDRFFDPEKIIVTGNPLRVVPVDDPSLKSRAVEYFGLASGKKTVLIMGGSLGARSINEAMMSIMEGEFDNGIQVIWQTGKQYYDEIQTRLEQIGWRNVKNTKIVPFIERMDYAYAAADLVICRSGASTISELQLLGKNTIFIPSPNVAEDHQTKNAMALVEVGAAIMIPDNEAKEKLKGMVEKLVFDNQKLDQLSKNIRAMAKSNSAEEVARIVEGVVNSDKNVFFVGIGGIGMSALARFFKHEGYNVAGYDLTQTQLTEKMLQEGIQITFEDDVVNIPKKFTDKKTTKIIYTPAIPKENKILTFFTNNKFEVMKRSQALGLLCNDKHLLAVAGTHGKTTTSSMVTHFMVAVTGEGSAFLGGIAKNFGTNAIIGNGDNMVVEADEFDRSFHRLTPNAALITSADPDHLDIYGTPEEFKHGFEQFVTKIKKGGKVIIKKGVDLKVDRKDIAIFSYSLDDKTTDYYAKNLSCGASGRYEFDLVTPSKEIEGCRLGVPGLISVENCIGAVALVDEFVFDKGKLRSAIASYSGVARRFDVWVNTPKIVYMDDYAHHPDELKAMLNSVKHMFPNRKITVVFQPHLFSRTKDFADQFANSLSIADRCILLPIYPARELPIEGVTSKIIFDKVTCEKEIVQKENLENRIKNLDVDVLITAGAGNIDQHCKNIAQIVKSKN